MKKLWKKNNNGYTLVELIVAVAILLIVMSEVGALMIQGQTLYKNGYFEVSLQENSQIIIDQVQNLLMNTNEIDRSVDEVIINLSSYSVSSDVLVLKSLKRKTDSASGNPLAEWENVTYTIGRDVDFDSSYGLPTTMKGESGKEYSTLYLQVDSATPIPIAEGVHSMHVEKLRFGTGDVVRLDLEMQNAQYSYVTGSEIYLRNQPGTGGPTAPGKSTATGAQVNLDVLRIHEYDLKEYAPDYDCFKWESLSDNKLSVTDEDTGDIIEYDLNGQYSLSENTGILKCNILNNSKFWKYAVDSVNIIAGKKVTLADGSVSYNYAGGIKINIHTDAVNDGERAPLYIYSTTTAPCLSVIPVRGICTCDTCASDVKMFAEITLPKITSCKTYDGTHDVDLALFRSFSGGFQTKTHYAGEYVWYDAGVSHNAAKGYKYSGDADAMKFNVGDWDNEIFAATDGDTLNIAQAVFEWQPRKHIDGKPLTFDPSKPDENYSKVAEYLKWPAEGGDWCAKYTLTRLKENGVNAFGLTSSQHVTKLDYWDNIVDNNGYVRIHIVSKYGTNGTYDAYGYYFPHEGGDDTQHNKLLDIVMGSDNTDDANGTDADPKVPNVVGDVDYGDYYFLNP